MSMQVAFAVVQFIFLSLFMTGWVAWRRMTCAQSPNCG
jgi:hypothetical protein